MFLQKGMVGSMEEELKEEIRKELEEITDVWILEQIKKCIINIKKED